MSVKKQDLYLMLVWPLFAAWLSLCVGANLLLSIIFFFVIPSVILSCLKPHLVKKLLIFSFVFGIPLAIVSDYCMQITGGWYAGTIFPWRVFGQGVIENLFWTPAAIYFVTIFYEVFFENEIRRKAYFPQFKYFFTFWLFVLISFFMLFYLNPNALIIHYFYLKIGLVLSLVPVLFMIIRYPKLIPKFFFVNLYFLYLFLVHELTALKLNQWSFPNKAEVIASISLLNFSLPLEEFLYFVVLGALAILSFYEFFDDDRR